MTRHAAYRQTLIKTLHRLLIKPKMLMRFLLSSSLLISALLAYTRAMDEINRLVL